MWVIIERSGRFWVQIQRIEEWKKIDKVRHLSDRGHDTRGLVSFHTHKGIQVPQYIVPSIVLIIKAESKCHQSLVMFYPSVIQPSDIFLC